MSRAVFLSRPSAMDRPQLSTYRRWCSALRQRGLILQVLQRDEYVDDPWPLLTNHFGKADGAAVFGFRQLNVVRDAARPGTDEESSAIASPWTQIEAGLAIAVGLPVLALAEHGVSEGIFNPTSWGGQVIGHELSEIPAPRALDQFLLAVSARSRRARRLEEMPRHGLPGHLVDGRADRIVGRARNRQSAGRSRLMVGGSCASLGVDGPGDCPVDHPRS